MVKLSSFFVICCALYSTTFETLAYSNNVNAEDSFSRSDLHAALVPNDAGVTNVRFFFDEYCGEEGYFIINFDNYGSNVLEKVTIEWTINGVAQEPYHWVGPAPPNYTAGYFTVPGSLNRFTIYTVKAWTTMPNDVVDGNPANDSKEEILKGPFSGTFTIGGTSPDFSTITEATEQMAKFNACGDVTFLIRPGEYNEQLVVKNSTASYITIQSETGDPASVVVSHAATSRENNYVWKLEGNHTTLEGITIKALGAEYATGIFVAPADFGARVIRNNTIVLSPGTEEDAEENKAGITGVIAAVTGNRIEGGTTAVQFQSYPEYHSQADIIGNEFRDQSNYAIHLKGISNARIINNDIHSNKSIVPESGAMMLENGFYAMIEENRCYTYGTGIALKDFATSHVRNNFVSVRNSDAATASHGISIDGSTVNNSILYNSVLVKEDMAGSLALQLQKINGDLEVNNNILYNKGGGLAVEILDFRLTRELQLDYNDIISSGPSLIHFFGRTPYADDDTEETFASLREWNQWSGYEEHSISEDPEFISDLDLHAQSYLLTGGGRPNSVATDIDGKTRDFVFPTIGAHEFGTLRINDMSMNLIYDPVICNTDQGVHVEVRNDGFAPITSFEITKTINGVGQAPETYMINMHPRSLTNLYIPVGTFLVDTQQSFSLTIAPTGEEDLYQKYNLVSMSFVIHPPVEIQVSNKTCDPPSATLTLPDGYSTGYWTGPGGFFDLESTSVTVSASGKYYVFAADANGCVSNDSTAINLPNLAARNPELEYDKASLCPGETIELRAVILSDTVPVAYSWLKDGQVISGAVDNWIDVDVPGEYSFTISSGPCSASVDPLLVSPLEPPTIPLIQQAGKLCPGEAVVLTVASDTEGYTFLWYMNDVPLSDWGSSPALGTAAPGSYWVEKSDANCKSVSTKIILEQLAAPSRPEVPTPNPICAGESVQLTAPEGFDAYLWSTGETTQAITTDKAGNYTVSVSNENCQSPISNPVKVTVNAIPVPLISVIGGILSATGGSTYQWFQNGEVMAGKTQASFQPEISGVYHVEATKLGCSAISDAITVSITGVENADARHIKFYPNPAQDYIILELSENLDDAEVKILNAHGMEFRPSKSGFNGNKLELDIGNLASGVYYLTVIQGVRKISTKVVVQKRS